MITFLAVVGGLFAVVALIVLAGYLFILSLKSWN